MTRRPVSVPSLKGSLRFPERLSEGIEEARIGELIEVGLGKESERCVFAQLLSCNRRILSVGAERSQEDLAQLLGSRSKPGLLFMPMWSQRCVFIETQGGPSAWFLLFAPRLRKRNYLLHFHSGYLEVVSVCMYEKLLRPEANDRTSRFQKCRASMLQQSVI